jgi:hypothetical protein
MKIQILGKIDHSFYTKKEIKTIPWISEGLVFVSYLTEDIFLGDVFVLEDETEITLQEIQTEFEGKEPLTMMGRGWKCLCRFNNLDLGKLPAIKSWLGAETIMIASRKQ